VEIADPKDNDYPLFMTTELYNVNLLSAIPSIGFPPGWMNYVYLFEGDRLEDCIANILIAITRGLIVPVDMFYALVGYDTDHLDDCVPPVLSALGIKIDDCGYLYAPFQTFVTEKLVFQLVCRNLLRSQRRIQIAEIDNDLNCAIDCYVTDITEYEAVIDLYIAAGNCTIHTLYLKLKENNLDISFYDVIHYVSGKDICMQHGLLQLPGNKRYGGRNGPASWVCDLARDNYELREHYCSEDDQIRGYLNYVGGSITALGSSESIVRNQLYGRFFKVMKFKVDDPTVVMVKHENETESSYLKRLYKIFDPALKKYHHLSQKGEILPPKQQFRDSKYFYYDRQARGFISVFRHLSDAPGEKILDFSNTFVKSSYQAESFNDYLALVKIIPPKEYPVTRRKNYSFKSCVNVYKFDLLHRALYDTVDLLECYCRVTEHGFLIDRNCTNPEHVGGLDPDFSVLSDFNYNEKIPISGHLVQNFRRISGYSMRASHKTLVYLASMAHYDLDLIVGKLNLTLDPG
jgi:hypothetical protein